MCKEKKKAVTPARDSAFFFQQFLADSNIFSSLLDDEFLTIVDIDALVSRLT